MQQRLKNLKESPLYEYRIKNKYKPVLGEGSFNAKVMLVGEAPGEQEALEGRPFIGRSGKFLRGMLSGTGINDVYITNLVLDRPPENRDPTPDEIKVYKEFLDNHIREIKPEVIVGLGRFSSLYLLRRFGFKVDRTISQIAGDLYVVKTGWGEVMVIPMFHPAAVGYYPKLREIYKYHWDMLGYVLA